MTHQEHKELLAEIKRLEATNHGQNNSQIEVAKNLLRMADIFDMKLHTYTYIDDRTSAFRVPGGWIYLIYSSNDTERSVFVPLPQPENGITNV